MKLAKLQESGLRKIVKLLSENSLDGSDVKVASDMVSGLSSVPNAGHRTNDSFLKQKYDEISRLRIAIMEYVEQNSGYKFAAKGGNGWKLVKK